MAKRIQMKRTRGWRKPPNVVYVGRPSKWGNPYTVQEHGLEDALTKYKVHLLAMVTGGYLDLRELEGRDLACWCPLTHKCHGDILLEEVKKGEI